MYRKILSGEKWRWYFQDILAPLWWATLSVLLFFWLAPYPTSNIMQILWLCTVFTVSLIISGLSAPFTRSSFKAIIAR